MNNTTVLSSIKELATFINTIDKNNILNILLQIEELEKDKNNLGNHFLDFKNEDAFFEEEKRLDSKIVDLENELNRFSVSAKGRYWKELIAEERDYILVKDYEEILSFDELANSECTCCGYNRLDNKTNYRIYFTIFRFSEDGTPHLTFYLARVK